MKPSVSYRFSAAAAAAMVRLLGSASVAANAPSDVADLVGARGAGGETELGNRGYTYVTMTKGVQSRTHRSQTHLSQHPTPTRFQSQQETRQ